MNSIFLIILYALFSLPKSHAAVCSLQSIEPNLFPNNTISPLEVSIFYEMKSSDVMSNPNYKTLKVSLSEYATQLNLDLISCTNYSQARGHIYNSYSSTTSLHDKASLCLYNATFDGSFPPGVRLLSFAPNSPCEGALPLQFYNLKAFDFKLVSNVLRKEGGNTLYLSYKASNFLLNDGLIKIQASKLGLGIVPKNSPMIVSFYSENKLHLEDSEVSETRKYLAGTIDYRILKFQGSSILGFTLDGYHYSAIPKAKVNLVLPSPLRVLFMFSSNNNTKNFNKAHKMGILKLTNNYTSSLDSTFDFSVDIANYDFDAFTTVLSSATKPYDIIYLIEPSISIETASKYATISYAINNKTQVVSTTPGNIGKYVQYPSNLNFIWSHIYQAKYLAGYMVGTMFKGTKCKICFLKNSNSNLSNLDLNAFVYGLQKAGYNETVHAYTLSSRNLEFESSWIANVFVELKCELVATNVDTLLAQDILTQSQVRVVGTNIDSRVELNSDYVLTSTCVKWERLYDSTISKGFNNSLASISLMDGYDFDGLYLSDYSSFVLQEIREELDLERERMIDGDPVSYVFKGPVVDQAGQQKVAPGASLSLYEVYTMNWTIAGVDHIDATVVPPIHDDQNLPEALLNSTYFFLSLSFLVIVVLMIWTYYHQKHPVIKFAQPVFLMLLLSGSLIGICTVIPLMDQVKISDMLAYTLGTEGLQNLRDEDADIACQSLSWLLLTGYGLTIPVLILKTWRLHQILKKARLGIRRSQKAMSQADMFKIIMAYLSISYILLLSLQLSNPMTYKIAVLEEDIYGNPIKSYGYCYLPDNNTSAGLFILIVAFVILIIVIGNVICFISRNDETVNNETTFISFSLVNFLQIILVGGPIMIILVEKPIPRFVVSVASVFLGFIGILGFIFLPKVVAIVFYDPESSQFTIHASGGGIKSGSADNSRPSVTPKPPKANDPGSNPASNLEKWRRNSHLSSLQSDSTTVESSPSLTTNPIIMVGNIENDEKKYSTAGLEIPTVSSTSQEELEKGQS